MENEEKERSVSRESNDSSRKLSLSEGSLIDKESSRSPEGSETGTIKKPRKFRPRKFIAKRFKSKKSDEQDQKTPESEQSEQETSRKTSVVSRISEKLSSPKLKRFNFVKRFSGTKSFKVSPSLDDTKSNLRKLENISLSESNMEKTKSEIDVRSVSTDIVNFEEQDDDLKASAFASSSWKEPVTLESRKVELKITISGKKTEKRGISPSAFDTASQQTHLTSEPSPQQTDIILPSSSTHVRLTTARDQFFNLSVSEGDKTEQKIKPINDEQTFAAVVKGGLSVRAATSEDSKEVEKYLILTSSLNSIISAAKELDDLTSTTEEEIKVNQPELERDSIEDILGIEREEIFTSSTPISRSSQRPSRFIDDSDTMKRNSGDKDSLTTVHTQEAHRPYHVSLSSSPSEESKSIKNELNASEIKFEVGTPVRPRRTFPASSASALGPETLSKYVDESFHSAESLDSFPSESRRRRIAYVPQLTIYSPEEQELLKSNIQANTLDSLEVTADSSMFPIFDASAATMSSPLDKREHLYKILVIGELGTGKTSFIKRYVHQFFSMNYRATIGVDFALKVLNWDASTIIRLQLWDIAGQERFGNMTRVYYKEAVGAFIVFDVTRSATFDAVLKWKQDLDTKVQLPDGSPIPCILLANKCDQPKQGLVTMPAKMDEYCKQNGFAGWFETSAKDNVNIEESAKALVNKILNNDRQLHNDMDGDRLVLGEGATSQKKFCSC